jgi:hypothetical protein
LSPLIILARSTDFDGDGLRDYYFTKRMSDFGPRGNNAKRDTFRVVGGSKARSPPTSGTTKASTRSVKPRKQTSDGQVNVLNSKRLEDIPDADDVDGDGNIPR